jgi:hypothetical protein
MNKAASHETNPVNALKLYNAYRFAVSSAMLIITAACCGYWIGFATIPLLAFVLYRYLGLENQTPDKTKILFAPRLGASTYAALFTNIAVWAYTFHLDPWLPAARPYTSNPSCMNWHKTSSSSVFVTSDHHIKGLWTDVIQWLSGIGVAYVILHHVLISKASKSKNKQEGIQWIDSIPEWTFVLVITQLGSIIYFVIISIVDGEAWFDTTIRRHPNAHYKALPQAQNLTNDIDTAIIISILGGVVCSLTRQRWAISKMTDSVKNTWVAIILFCTSIPFIIFSVEFNAIQDRASHIGSYSTIYTLCFAVSVGFVVVSFRELRGVPQITNKNKVKEDLQKSGSNLPLIAPK